MGGDRRRQRQQRIRHDPGSSDNQNNAGNQSNISERKPNDHSNQGSINRNPAGVAYAEPKQYESVTIMESKSTDKEEPAPPSKYKRRQVLSNWSRYEEVVADEDIEEGEDYMLGEDFSKVLQMNDGKSGGYLHLKGEMSWGESDTGLLDSHGLGALKLVDLVSAINTIPLHTQLNIPEDKLNKQLIEQFNLDAETSKLDYKPNEEFISDVEVNDKFLQSLKISDDSLDLAPDVPDANVVVRSSVEATKSFASAFQPEDDDADLETLINESNQNSLADLNNGLLNKGKSPSPLLDPTACNLIRTERSPSPYQNTIKGKSPSVEPTLKEKSPSLEPRIKEKSPSPLVIQSTVKKSPSPSEIQRNIKNNNASETDSKTPISVPPLIKSEKFKSLNEQPTTNLNFGLPQKSESNSELKPSIDFDIPKLDTSAPRGQRTKKRGNRNKITQVDETNDVLSDVADAETKTETSYIDLDAPVVKEQKPVLLVSETETQNLEDWLDSVLDD